MSDPIEQLKAEVRRLAHLVAVVGTDGKPQREQVRILAAAGFVGSGNSGTVRRRPYLV